MALPVSDEDMAMLLSRNPTMKALLELPARVAALEDEVRQLKGGVMGNAQRAVTNPCQFCGCELKLTGESDHPQLGIFGVKKRTFECENCGKVTSRDYDPAKG